MNYIIRIELFDRGPTYFIINYNLLFIFTIYRYYSQLPFTVTIHEKLFSSNFQITYLSSI